MGSMMKGWATTEGTARYRARFARTAAGDHFTQHRGLWLSSVGMGTYLGEPDDADDAAYDEAARAALPAGGNVFDCAINYRFQRSERAPRGALAALDPVIDGAVEHVTAGRQRGPRGLVVGRVVRIVRLPQIGPHSDGGEPEA